MDDEPDSKQVKKLKEQMDRRKKYHHDYYQKITKPKRKAEKQELINLRKSSPTDQTEPLKLPLSLVEKNQDLKDMFNKLKEDFNDLSMERDKLLLVINELSMDNDRLQEINNNLRQQNFELTYKITQTFIRN